MDKIDRIIAGYKKNVMENENHEDKLISVNRKIEECQQGIYDFFVRINTKMDYRRDEFARSGAYSDARILSDAADELNGDYRKADNILYDENEKVSLERKKVSQQREDIESQYRKDMFEQ